MGKPHGMQLILQKKFTKFEIKIKRLNQFKVFRIGIKVFELIYLLILKKESEFFS